MGGKEARHFSFAWAHRLTSKLELLGLRRFAAEPMAGPLRCPAGDMCSYARPGQCGHATIY